MPEQNHYVISLLEKFASIVGAYTTRWKWIIWKLTSEVGLPRMADLVGSSGELGSPSGISGSQVKSPPRFIPALFGDSRKMAAVPLYCVCRQPYDVSRFMIECDICKDWFHGRYVDYGSLQRCRPAKAVNMSRLSQKSDGCLAVLTGS